MSVDLTPEVLDGIEARAWSAAPGPWLAWPDQDGKPHMHGLLMVGNADAVIPEGEVYVEGVDVNPIAHTYTPEDRAHIAGLDPGTVLALVAAARERDELREDCQRLSDDCAVVEHERDARRAALTNARATASDAIASRDKITADIMAERDEARATVARVEALHAGNSTRPTSDHYYCEWGECDRSGEGELRAYCDECGVFAPCDTAKALRGAGQ